MRTSALITCVALFSLVNTASYSQQPPVLRDVPLNNELSRAALFKYYTGIIAKEEKTFAFPPTFNFPFNATTDVDGSPRRDTYFGIDISHYQGENFPVSKLKEKGIYFIYVKAFQGLTSYDDMFARNWARLAALPPATKILRGAYHFLSSGDNASGSMQAENFIDYVNGHGGFDPQDLPPAADLEWDKACQTCLDRWSRRSVQDIINTVHDFRDRVKARTGRTLLLYTNKRFLLDRKFSSADMNSITEGLKVWIFDISAKDNNTELPDPKTNLKHDLWQFRFDAKIPGVYTGGLDADVFKGSDQAFNDLAHKD